MDKKCKTCIHYRKKNKTNFGDCAVRDLCEGVSKDVKLEGLSNIIEKGIKAGE